MSLKGKTIVITGSSRGIGKTIALRLAKEGANIAILAKTAEKHPKLPGTIYTAAKEVEKAGGKALPIVCDIRFEDQVNKAISKVYDKFGGIDILVNNASAIQLTDTANTSVSRYDLMNSINARGTWLMSKVCLPHLKKSNNPHILNISPPLSLRKDFFSGHVAYSIAKFGMSLCTLGMSEEFKKYNIAVNSLWPHTVIYTAALQMLEQMNKKEICRTPEIMADAAYLIMKKKSIECTGNFFIDEQIMYLNGIKDLSKYSCVEGSTEFGEDLFIDNECKQKLRELKSKL